VFFEVVVEDLLFSDVKVISCIEKEQKFGSCHAKLHVLAESLARLE
jgi:hypothetical protein